MSEANQQQLIRLAAPRHNAQLLRNNSGACTDQTGRVIRYGLGNDSAKLNKVFKSSDLIGFQTVTVTPDMIGHKLAVFMGVEVKAPGWSLRPGDKRAQAQQSFGDWVTQHGGIFRFATKPEDVWGGT